MKVVSFRCPHCNGELICPSSAAGKPMHCPHCEEEVTFGSEEFGLEADGGHRLPEWARPVLATLPLLLAAAIFVMLAEERLASGILDPKLTLRCASCLRTLRKARSEWEAQVFAIITERNRAGSRNVVLPELTPLPCPHCGENAVYPETIRVRNAGKLPRPQPGP